MNALRRHLISQRGASDRGASLAEYALLVGLIAVVSLGAISFLGGEAEAKFLRVGSEISGDDVAAGLPAGSEDEEGLVGGDPSGGDPSGGDPTGGSPTGGSPSGGDPSGGSPTGGSPSGGDPSGGDPSGGGDTSGGTEAGTIEPLAPTKTSGTGSATRKGNTWSSEASFVLFGSDGKPLDVGNAQAQVKVMWTYTTWDGQTQTQQYKTTQAQIASDGTVTFIDDGFEMKQGHNVTSVSYQIVDVFYYYPNNPPVKWDGEKAFVKIDAP